MNFFALALLLCAFVAVPLINWPVLQSLQARWAIDGQPGYVHRSCCDGGYANRVHYGARNDYIVRDHYKPCYFRLHSEDYFVCDLPLFPCPKINSLP